MVRTFSPEDKSGHPGWRICKPWISCARAIFSPASRPFWVHWISSSERSIAELGSPSNREGSGQTTEYRSWIPLRIDRKVNAAPFQCMDLFGHGVLYRHHRTQLSVASFGGDVQRRPK